jgi:hypothetical protein
MLCLLLLDRKEKEKEKQPRGFYPRAGHALLGGPHGIFMAVKCK